MLWVGLLHKRPRRPSRPVAFAAGFFVPEHRQLVYFRWSRLRAAKPQQWEHHRDLLNSIPFFLRIGGFQSSARHSRRSSWAGGRQSFPAGGLGFLPEGKEWGPTSAVYPDRDGVHIWVAERCGPTDLVDNRGESCLDKDVDPILKFDADGNVVESFGAGGFLFSWGEIGHDWGEFMQPHALAMDSQGRLFVGDRSNNRIQIFDQMGTFLETWVNSAGPVASISMPTIRSMSLTPNPPNEGGGAEGVAADAAGNVYGAETRTNDAVRRSQALTKYVRVRP